MLANVLLEKGPGRWVLLVLDIVEEERCPACVLDVLIEFGMVLLVRLMFVR